MPQISFAFSGWMNSITLIMIKQTIVNGLVQELQTPVTFQGVIQPLKAREIRQYPEGQRAWAWLQIHCMGTQLQLTVNDKIIYNGKQFKVMGKLNYELNNYIEYHAVADFTP